jgi:tetratricopeptide (TPR) repeat protein
MATIVVPLKDIAVESDSPVELTSLPEDQAVALIRKIFGFLSSSLQIGINGDVATITLPPANAERAEEALRLYQRGVKQAEKGEYLRAIKMFQQVLSDLPEHIDARRNLGMAYLEAGDKQRAKQYLLETIRLDPKDAWSHVLLGNIYSKHENNYAEAEKHYQHAYELRPVDAILLTNYGAMRVEQGRRDDARRYFEEAIQADARYPNSYYGLALLHQQARRENEGIKTLDGMFTPVKLGDMRLSKLYDLARKLYADANRKLAEQTYSQLMEVVETRKRVL